MSIEIWLPIKGYEGFYEVSNFGKIRSLDRLVDGRWGVTHRKGRILTGGLDKDGYRLFILSKNGLRKTHKLHRLIAVTFIENPYGYSQINHKDGNKQNNRVDNLEWVTPQKNIQHAFTLGLNKSSPLNWSICSKAVLQYTTDGKFIRQFPSMSEVERTLGIKVSRVSACCNGKNKTAGGFIWKLARG